MVYLRCTVPRRCPKDAINQSGGGGCTGEGGHPPARSDVFNISGDECNRMEAARGFPQEWRRAAGNRCVVCLLVWPPNLFPLTLPPLSRSSIFSPLVLFSNTSSFSFQQTSAFPRISEGQRFLMNKCPFHYPHIRVSALKRSFESMKGCFSSFCSSKYWFKPYFNHTACSIQYHKHKGLFKLIDFWLRCWKHLTKRKQRSDSWAEVSWFWRSLWKTF